MPASQIPEHYWLFRTWDLKLPPGLRLLTFMATHLCHVRFASVCRTRQGPDDFNRYSYFFVRLYCTGPGFQANIVEECGLLTAFQHIFAGFEEDSRSEVGFWVEQWSVEFGYHWLIVEEHVLLSAFAAHLRGFEEDPRSGSCLLD